MTAHQPPTDPLVKILADATGETTAEVQGVLQQVRAVLHQEHTSAATGGDDASSTTDTTTTATGTADGTAPAEGQPAVHWHDRLIASQDAAGSSDTTGGTAASGDEAGTIWQHFLNHYAAGDSAVTTDADVAAAVDEFVDTVQSLHLDPMQGQMHGHGLDGAHLDSAA